MNENMCICLALTRFVALSCLFIQHILLFISYIVGTLSVPGIVFLEELSIALIIIVMNYTTHFTSVGYVSRKLLR